MESEKFELLECVRDLNRAFGVLQANCRARVEAEIPSNLVEVGSVLFELNEKVGFFVEGPATGIQRIGAPAALEHDGGRDAEPSQEPWGSQEPEPPFDAVELQDVLEDIDEVRGGTLARARNLILEALEAHGELVKRERLNGDEPQSTLVALAAVLRPLADIERVFASAGRLYERTKGSAWAAQILVRRAEANGFPAATGGFDLSDAREAAQ